MINTRLTSFSKRLLAAVLVCLLLGTQGGTIWAQQTDTDRDLLFPLYDDTIPVDFCSTSSDSSATGQLNNQDYAGRPILTDAQVQAINENRRFYEQAANQVDVPWQAIAVIHIREHNLSRSNPPNGDGLYQFDNSEGGPYPTGPVSDAEFLRQTIFMAERLKNDFSQRTPIAANRTVSASNAAPDAIKDMFFSYNGRSEGYAQQGTRFGFDPATQPFEGSPYVMNKADANRDPSVNTTTWGQVKRNNGPIEYPANNDYGAFVIYTALAGLGTICTSETGNNQRVVEVAREELAAAANEANGTHTKYGGTAGQPWCGFFVSWVFEHAGKPLEGGPYGAVSAIRTWAQQQGYWYPAEEQAFTPIPGDIVVYDEGLNPYPSHVNIVVGYDPSTRTITTIGGNEGDSVRERSAPTSMPAITGFVRVP